MSHGLALYKDNEGWMVLSNFLQSAPCVGIQGIPPQVDLLETFVLSHSICSMVDQSG